MGHLYLDDFVIVLVAPQAVLPIGAYCSLQHVALQVSFYANYILSYMNVSHCNRCTVLRCMHCV